MRMDDTYTQQLERLLSLYGDAILRLCATILSDHALAEDAWQETWLKVWKGLPNFQGKSSAKTWITRIAVNTCRDIRRSRYFRFEHRTLEDEALQNLPAPTPPQELGITEAIQTLPMRYRTAIMLYYMQEQTIREIAQTLGISPNTAASRIRRGRERLREILGGGDRDD